MRRVGIYVIYDKNGIVDEYIYNGITELKKVCWKVIVVINGKCGLEYLKRLNASADIVYKRKNQGYDGEAYRSIILKENWNSVDELILCNDTFYGPLYGWKTIISDMKNCKAEFWGLSSYLIGYSQLLDRNIASHIQGYFIFIREKLLHSSDFIDFWKIMPKINNYYDAIMNFEVGFSEYFLKRGFQYDDWLTYTKDFQYKSGEVVYGKYAYELIANYRFPILKKKVLSLDNYIERKRILDVIFKENKYEATLISENIKRLDNLENTKPFNARSILEFCKEREKLYIWGAGKVGRNILAFLNDNQIYPDGYIVTEKNVLNRKDIFTIDEIDLSKGGLGIIVALGRNNFREVYENYIKNDNRQIYWLPDYERY